MHLEIWNVQRLKDKREIIIKDLELDIIIPMETKKRAVDWKRLIDLFIFIVKRLKRNEQKGEFLQS